MRRLTNVLITGGAGFVGSNFIRYLLSCNNFYGIVINVDKLTYAGNLENLIDVESKYGTSRYFFRKVDICNFEAIRTIFREYEIDTVVNFAAESHVDRSIAGPKDFIRTNILGTFTLLEATREAWKDRDDVLFHQVSTDEVFGSLGTEGRFNEESAYRPRSPYAASKAAADHLVHSYYHTYEVPITLSNCTNNYGPCQFPEKMIPLMILRMMEESPLPVYGDGKNIRDWIYVDDHSSAIWLILTKGKSARTYAISGENECQNIDLVGILCERMAKYTGKNKDYYLRLVTHVKDRPGHDMRYAIDCTKIKEELGWKPITSFEDGLDRTIRWYVDNKLWVDRTQNSAYRQWISDNYDAR